MHRRLRTLLPLLGIAGLLLVAATPAIQSAARDGKARAIEAGHLEIEQRVAASEAVALSSSNQAFVPTPGASCTSGFAGPYECENIDLLSIVPIPEIGAALGSDVWGWTDPETGREIAIPTTTFGAAFVDVTDPSAPQVLGRIQQAEQDSGVLWRDVKVYEDHAFLVSEHDTSGMAVFDLTRLRGVTSDQGFFDVDVLYEEFENAHNIAINEETGFAYVVGSNTCEGGVDEDELSAGGLHMIDISDPKNPVFAGCFGDDGYTHDVQCTIYRGLDTEFQGSEICFAANENTLTIVDVTDKSNPEMLSRSGYDGAAYTHQGWTTPNHRWFVFGDELDENGALSDPDGAQSPNTLSYIMEITDLREPGEVMVYTHETTSIDHNLYFAHGYLWQGNYSSGLRVFDYSDESLSQGQLEPVAFFDVDPGQDLPEFAGAWTAYPYFESGTIVVNSFDSGMFLLRSTLEEQTEEAPPFSGAAPAPAPEPEPAPDEEPAGSALPATGGGLALIGIVLVGAAVSARRFGRTI